MNDMAFSGLKQITSCLGYAQHTSTGSAFKLSTAPAAGIALPTDSDKKPSCVLLQAEAKNLRWRDDGTAPTSTVGFILYAGQEFLYDGDLSKIQFIQTESGSILNCCYYC
jgi:hypothetical protein